jgi:endonuclease-3
MARESTVEKKKRAAKIIACLEAAYPEARCELNYSTPLELLIATILSAQCTDRQVNIVTETLFKKYRSAKEFAATELTELENDIRRIGLFRNKAKSIRAACETIVRQHGGDVPRTMEELIELGGVGRKTANVVLGNAFGLSEGVVVDTHVARLSARLAWSRHMAPEKIERDLQELAPREKWTLLSHLLIWHGRRRCPARVPDCPHCEIRSLCPTGQKVLDPKLSPEQSETLRKKI